MVKIDMSHHAYGIAGDVGAIGKEIGEMIEKDLGVSGIGNPDFFHEKFEPLTIEDARRIKAIHAGKAFVPDKPRVFIIGLYGATREAQNALLKVIEEPRPGNYFFLIMPSLDILLPTLKSRLCIVSFSPKSRTVENPIAKFASAAGFRGKSVKDRIVFADDMAVSIRDGASAKHQAVDFLNDLEASFHEQGRIGGNSAKYVSAFDAIAVARHYMNDHAPSVKMLLEYVALSV